MIALVFSVSPVIDDTERNESNYIRYDLIVAFTYYFPLCEDT